MPDSLGPTRYLTPDGRIAFVSPGISSGTVWMTVYLKRRGATRRLVSPALPLRHTRDEAQADLDAYALAKGFKEVGP